MANGVTDAQPIPPQFTGNIGEQATPTDPGSIRKAQAWVSKKTRKRDILRVFTMSDLLKI
jgi:hypothetical protein